MSSEKPTKITKQQKEMFVDLMFENNTFLYGKFSSNDGKKIKDKKWQEICDQLNSIGPPKKDVSQWKRVFQKLLRM